MCLVTKPNQTLVTCAVTLLAVEMGWGPSIKTGTKEIKQEQKKKQYGHEHKLLCEPPNLSTPKH